MAEEERVYTIPLAKAQRNASRNEKASKSMREIKRFLRKHMKTDDVKIGSTINDEIWSRGVRSPPSKIRIKARKEEGTVYTELEGEEITIERDVEEEIDEEIQEEVQEELAEEIGEEFEEEFGEEVDYEEIVSGTIKEAKSEINSLEDPNYEELIKAEEENKDRKTLIEWIKEQKPEEDTEDEVEKREDEAATMG